MTETELSSTIRLIRLAQTLRFNFKKTAWLSFLSRAIILLLLVGINIGCTRHSEGRNNTTEIDKKIYLAMDQLFAEIPMTMELSKLSKGALVFPDVTEVGFAFGGLYGKGAMIVDDEIYGYYKASSASFGLFTFGAQSFGMVIFLMTDDALSRLQKNSEWQFGTGLKVVFGYKGMASRATSDDDLHVFIFGQKGVMAQIGSIEAMKITRVDMY